MIPKAPSPAWLPSPGSSRVRRGSEEAGAGAAPHALETARERLLRDLDALGPTIDRDHRLEVPLEGAAGTAPLAWLPRTDVYPQGVFTSSRSGRRVYAFGAARTFSLPARASAGTLVAHAQARLRPGTGPLVGAARFAPAIAEERVDPAWAAFGGGLFFLPRVLVEEREGRAVLAVHLCADRPPDEERALARRALLAINAGALESPVGARISSAPVPLAEERARFSSSVERALAILSDEAPQALEEQALEKVVLARRVVRALTRPPSAIAGALRALEAAEPFGASYLLALSPGDAWIGKSPELLVHRRGAALESEAVAGTRPRGGTIGEDVQLAAELFGSDKDAREHQLVRAHIEGALRTLGACVRVREEPELRRLSRVMHLVSPVGATLPGSLEDGALVDALHPTPAIAGVPTGAALGFLEAHEGFDRGLYAGPVGLVDEDELELWIGLRGARLLGGALTLYAGAGIVAGSDPEAEWRETEAKASALLGAFEGAR